MDPDKAEYRLNLLLDRLLGVCSGCRQPCESVRSNYARTSAGVVFVHYPGVVCPCHFDSP